MDDVNEDGSSSGSCCCRVNDEDDDGDNVCCLKGQSDDGDSDGHVNLYNRLRDDELVIILCVMCDVLCFCLNGSENSRDRAQIQCKICILYSND